ncbi:MAG: hypothetical protein A4E73_02452 [Syntrophaceae bacterium PtaU1.Bin231]|jgi:hypothetical protein|nr:MAG: hypothetical protein A4E73_02452 [Syntrophaceae bacterium PtaU1.Bin231]
MGGRMRQVVAAYVVTAFLVGLCFGACGVRPLESLQRAYKWGVQQMASLDRALGYQGVR